MIRDGEYGIYKVTDSDDAIVYVGHSASVISSIDNDLRTSSNDLGEELRKHGAAWSISWAINPKLTSSQNIQKIATGFVNRYKPRFN